MLESFLPSYFEWWHIPVVFLAGLLGEGYGSLVGGGSLIIQPVLLLLGLPIHSALATDNAAALGTEVGILSETYQKVLQNKKLVLWMAVPMALGGVIGTWLLLSVPADVIKYLMAIAVSLVLVRSRLPRKQAKPKALTRRKYAALFTFLLLAGIYNNFILIAEGTFSKIAMMSILGMSFVDVQGIKSTATIPIRLYALIVTGFAGLIVWPYLLTFWCSNFLAGKYATRFVKKIPDSYARSALTAISIGFIVYLIAIY